MMQSKGHVASLKICDNYNYNNGYNVLCIIICGILCITRLYNLT